LIFSSLLSEERIEIETQPNDVIRSVWALAGIVLVFVIRVELAMFADRE
jgi:hypothetical protein